MTLTYATIYVSMVLYASTYALRRFHRLRTARLFWTFGFFIFVAHVLCAFAFVHRWSHDDAYRVTAERTAEMTGLYWGGGIHANYVFALAWFVDVVWWWRGLDAYEQRPRAVTWALHGFLAFIAFNATVVFGRMPTRVVGTLVCVTLIWMYLKPWEERGLSPRDSLG